MRFRTLSLAVLSSAQLASCFTLSGVPGTTLSSFSARSRVTILGNVRSRLDSRPVLPMMRRRAVESSERSRVATLNVKADVLDGGVRPDKQAFVQVGLEDALRLYGSSTRWLVGGSVALVLLVRSDSATLVYVVGSLLNAVMSKILKKVINQGRPDGSVRGEPGMPSSHAMSLFFLGTYVAIAIQESGLVGPGLSNWWLDVPTTQLLIAFYASTASLWRVRAGLHTLAQVSVGAVLGAINATLWYYLCRKSVIDQVDILFGGPRVPLPVVVMVCMTALFIFGSLKRKIEELLGREGAAGG